MMRKSESGRGRFSSLFWLAVLAAVLYAVWNVGPLYYWNYMLKDQMEQLARTPLGPRADAVVEKGIADALRECDLREHLSVSDFKVTFGEGSRTISVEYEREANILPGWPRVFRFSIKAQSRVF